MMDIFILRSACDLYDKYLEKYQMIFVVVYIHLIMMCKQR